MILEFICGCSHEINVNDPEDVGWWKQTSTDREGYLICTLHRQRRKKFASLPEGAAKQLADWRYAGYSALELEQHEVFGRPLPERTTNLDFSIEDRRDIRDPQMVGIEIFAALAGEGNGHVPEYH